MTPIVINYDLMKKKIIAGESYSIKRNLITNKKKIGIAYSVYVALCLYSKIPLIEILEFTPVTIGTLFISSGLCDILDLKLLGDVKQLKARHDLSYLCNQLIDRNTHTNLELLLQSEQIKTEYTFDFKENSLFPLLQKKYILVPTYNTYSGQIQKESICQEHRVGTNKYVLTLGSPKRVYKPVFQGC